ncbi:MAG: UDP-4-amino-4,6-dideoxy-N-acetyl-beta-L-altrosamine transaminase [Kiritimatiellae bacterium]|nr:UDP-4-amino-4,6-dideoxy-N-acetyl-beta-L-altrosamine transaminase [Kiritimatiellia bacterium]
MIPYGKQSLDEADIAAVVSTLRGDWLTQGPAVPAFEDAFAAKVGAKYAVAVNSGTAALHAIMRALNVGQDDEVIVPPITFTASANCAAFEGATPVFVDVDPETLLIDPVAVERAITPRTRAIVAVDYTGHPCDYDALREIANRHQIALVADACHSPGASYKGRAVGTLADLTAFSFHPVKHITTGEGGLVSTDNPVYAEAMRDFRTHGITKDPARFLGLEEDAPYAMPDASSSSAIAEQGPWYYEMHSLGYNYRMPDINAALGLSQLTKLDAFVARRRKIAARYQSAFELAKGVRPLRVREWANPAWHLFVVRIDFATVGRTRTEVMQELREQGIGTQVHYIPVHLQPFYRRHFNTALGQCPVAETAYVELLSLPMYPAMTDDDVDTVINAVSKTVCGK